MDFFEHQDVARRKTWQLVWLFLLGVLLTVLLVNLLVYGLQTAYFVFLGGDRLSLSAWLTSNLGWQLSLATVAVIAGGSLLAYLQLRQGGQVVAKWAGAVPVDYDAPDPAQKRFIHAVEEMSIAAGTPVPSLYVMHNEPAINAFVAGYQADQAVLVISRGALNELSRDELQGVIGHEFSHILNGDMRLNIRLMAVLAGLVQLGQLGRWLMEYSSYRSGTYSRNSRDSFAFPILGMGLVAVGYIGVLTGRIIKSAVSRQRELLADASSVQFTRNPDGIAGALYKIKEHATGSSLNHRHAEDISHLCFGESIGLSGMLASHPPLEERIRRVHPTFLTRARHRGRQSESAEEAVARTQPVAFDQAMGAAVLTAMAGQVTPAHMEYARKLYKHIPEQVRASVHQSAGARAFCYGQILLASPGYRQPILNQVKIEDPEAALALQPLWPFYKQLDAQLRLPLLDMAVPVLKRLDERARLVFLDRIDRLVQADSQVAVREWVLAAQLKHHLRPGGERRDTRSRPFHQAGGALTLLLSALVHNHRRPDLARSTYEQVLVPFDIEDKTLRPKNETDFERVADSLELLSGVAFFWRGAVIQACVDLLRADDTVHQDEYELIRTIADCLGCPLPPLAEHEWSAEP